MPTDWSRHSIRGEHAGNKGEEGGPAGCGVIRFNEE